MPIRKILKYGNLRKYGNSYSIMESLNHGNRETQVIQEITELQKFILNEKLLSKGNTEKLPVLTKQVRKCRNTVPKITKVDKN